MKRIFLFFIFIILNMAIACATNNRDVITQYLKEFIDGKETGNVKYIEIELFDIKNKISWIYTEVYFNSIDNEKATAIGVKQSKSDDTFRTPLLSNLKWKPGEKLTYQINDGVDNFNFVAIKNKSNKKFDWIVSGKGKYSLNKSDGTHTFEWRGVKEYDLKYKKLKCQALYYK